QIYGGPPQGEKEGKNLTVDAPSLLHLLRRQCAFAGREEFVNFCKIRSVPGEEPVTQSRYLALARGRRQRNRIDVVADDLSLCGERTGTVLVAAERRRSDLAEL